MPAVQGPSRVAARADEIRARPRRSRWTTGVWVEHTGTRARGPENRGAPVNDVSTGEAPDTRRRSGKLCAPVFWDAMLGGDFAMGTTDASSSARPIQVQVAKKKCSGNHMAPVTHFRGNEKTCQDCLARKRARHAEKKRAAANELLREECPRCAEELYFLRSEVSSPARRTALIIFPPH